MDIAVTVTQILDRLAHASTTDQDALNSVYGLRRLVKDTQPSTLLATKQPPQTKLRQLNSLINQLRTEIATLKSENQTMEGELQRLQEVNPRLDPNCYSYDEVMQIIREKFGMSRGMTLWVDYNQQLRAVDPSIPKLTLSALQTWRKTNNFPIWAVDQLLEMPETVARPMHRWSEEDRDYLYRLYSADPSKTDDQLASDCSQRFGCTLNSNSIKCQLNILRKEGRLTFRRKRAV